MSGGHFDYKQYHLEDIASEIEELIDRNDGFYDYSKETLEEFKNAIPLLRKAAIYAQRIDWLVSGDDGEDDFHERLQEELEEFSEDDN